LIGLTKPDYQDNIWFLADLIVSVCYSVIGRIPTDAEAQSSDRDTHSLAISEQHRIEQKPASKKEK